MEAMPRRARLPRRGREPLLLGAIHTAARDDVGTDHGPHGRGVPPRQARRRSRALVIQSQAHDGARAHAIEPSALRRLDAGADQAAGRRDRPCGRERLEAACDRALEIGARSYTSVTSILKTNLDRKRPAPATDGPAITHTNIRGPRYFHRGEDTQC